LKFIFASRWRASLKWKPLKYLKVFDIVVGRHQGRSLEGEGGSGAAFPGSRVQGVTKLKSNPITGLDRPLGFHEVEAPRFLDSL
jgi:hypothetical protein